MLDHLLAQDPQPLNEAALSFVPLDEASTEEILSAKINTEDWLKSLGAEDTAPIDPAYERALATQAFGCFTAPAMDDAQKRKAVMEIRTPEAIRKVVGMLTAYEWEFVQQAKQLRSYIVTGLMEETKNVKPEVRLKAYKMLGEVTEVALFTQRTEIVSSKMSDKEVEEAIKRRLEKLTIDMPLIERVDKASMPSRIGVDDE
jgi:hypothetical protein